MTKSIWKMLRTHQASSPSYFPCSSNQGQKKEVPRSWVQSLEICAWSACGLKKFWICLLVGHVLFWLPQFFPLLIVLYPTASHIYVIWSGPWRHLNRQLLPNYLWMMKLYAVKGGVATQGHIPLFRTWKRANKTITLINSSEIINNTSNMSSEGFKIYHFPLLMHIKGVLISVIY